jgi:hypothetical protein
MRQSAFKQLKIGDHFLLTEDAETICKKTAINQYRFINDPDVIHVIIPMTKVFQKEIELWIIRDHKTEGLSEPKKVICTKVESDVYYLEEYPYKIAIPDAFGVEHGYGSGFGNVWGWSYFVCLSETIATQLHKKLQNEFEEKRKPRKHLIAGA